MTCASQARRSVRTVGVRAVTTADAHDKLRNELLKSSRYDDVPLAQVESVITGGDLAEGIPEMQQLALSVIRCRRRSYEVRGVR
jgi:hypothetical protein